MFGNVPRALWERWAKPDSIGRIRLACRAMLVELDGLRILCEAGIGAYMEPELAKRYGVEGDDNLLEKSLRTLGLQPDDIDFVILSHLHFDHAGGLLPSYREQQNGRKGLIFPKAKILVGREAWERSQAPHPRDRASFIPELQKILSQSDRLVVVDGDSHPSLPSQVITFRYSSGHTPGQMHTLVQGGTESFFFAGDLVPGRAWVHLPVTMGYDRFAEMVIDEKTRLYQEALPRHWNLFFTHDTDVVCARLGQDEKSKFSPVAEHKTLERYAI